MMFKNCALFFVTLMFVQSVSARNVTDATIDKVRPDNWQSGGIFLSTTGGTTTNSGTCTSDGWYFINKNNNPMLNELLSVALSAKVSGSSVTVWGNGICTENSYEGIRYIELK